MWSCCLVSTMCFFFMHFKAKAVSSFLSFTCDTVQFKQTLFSLFQVSLYIKNLTGESVFFNQAGCFSFWFKVGYIRSPALLCQSLPCLAWPQCAAHVRKSYLTVVQLSPADCAAQLPLCPAHAEETGFCRYKRYTIEQDNLIQSNAVDMWALDLPVCKRLQNILTDMLICMWFSHYPVEKDNSDSKRSINHMYLIKIQNVLV